MFFKKCHKGNLSVRKRSEHHDLRRGQGVGDRLTLLSCSNAVWLMVRTALIYKAAKSQALKSKDKHQLPVFRLYSKKIWTTRTLFLDWFHQCFVPEIRKYSVSKRLPFKVLLIMDNAPDHPDPMSSTSKRLKRSSCP